VAVSTSAVDNVEAPLCAEPRAGTVRFAGLESRWSFVSSSETYALAFEFFSLPLGIARSGTNVVLTWPIYPAGFVLQAAAIWLRRFGIQTTRLPR